MLYNFRLIDTGNHLILLHVLYTKVIEINLLKIGTNARPFTLNLQKIPTSVEVNIGHCVTSIECNRYLN